MKLAISVILSLLIRIVGFIGWQRLLKWTWQVVKPHLEKVADSTKKTDIDNRAIIYLDKIIMTLALTGDAKIHLP